MADDSSNDYLKTVTPLSNEEFQAKLAEHSATPEELDLPPINVTAKRIPDDGSLDDNGDPVVIPPAQHTELVGGSATDVNKGGQGGEGVHGVGGYTADIARGAWVGANSAVTEIGHTIANIADFLAPDAWTKDPEYFTKMAEEADPSLKDTDKTFYGAKVPASVAGELTKTTAQFMTGFLPGISAMKGIKAMETAGGIPGAVKSLAGTTAAANISMASAFDPMQKRLSNFAKDSGIPGFDNAVTEWLAQDDNDPALLGRVKQMAEGHILGKVLEPFVAMLGVFKTAKRVVLEEHGVLPKSPTTAAYMTDPATGAKVDVTAQMGDEAPRFTLKEPSVVVPNEAVQQDFAHSYLDGDYEGAAQKTAGLVNLKYLNTEEGIRDMIEGFSLVKNAAIEKNVRGWSEAARKAGKLGADALPEAAARVQGLDSFVIKAEETRTAVAYKVKELAQIAKASPSEVTMAEFKDAFKKLFVIDSMVTGNKSEIARAMKAMQRPTTGGDIAQNILAKSKRTLGASGQTQWDLMAETVGNMPDSTGIIQVAKAAATPNWKDAVTEVYINALFSPPTFAVNAMSNSLSMGGTVLERYAGAARSQLTGSGELTFREANNYALGLAKGISEGASAFAQSWRTNAPVLGTEGKFLESNHQTAFSAATFGIKDGDAPLMMKLGKALDLAGVTLRSLPGGTRSLMASDEFYKAMFYRGELNALAQREAQKEGLKEGSPEYLVKIKEVLNEANHATPGTPFHGISLSAQGFAETSTFTEALGEGGTKMLEGLRTIPGSYIALPFVKTPVNLIKYMSRRTPGLSGYSNYMEAELAAGGARADLAEAQIGLGSMYLTAGLVLASGGYFQGAITDNVAAKRNLIQMGVEEQSYVNQETGEQTALGRLDGNPLSFLLFSATVHETVQAYINANKDEMTDSELEDGVMHILAVPLGAGAKLALQKSWTQGMAQLLDAVQKDTEGNYLQKLAGNLLPAGNTIKWVNKQHVDPYLREADSAFEEIQSKIPGLSKSLPPVPDLLGNPTTTKQLDGFGTNPVTQRIPDDSHVMTELRRLQMEKPNEVIMGGVTRQIDDVKLDGVEKWNFMQFVRHIKDGDGKDLVDSMEEVMNSPDYKSPEMTDGKRNNLLTDMYNKRKDLAKKAIQFDSLAFSQGNERPYAKEYDLYDYKRITPLASKVGTKAFTKAQNLFGNVGIDRQTYIDQRNDEIVKSNLGVDLK